MLAEGDFEVVVEVEEVESDGDGAVAKREADVGVCLVGVKAKGLGKGGAGGGEEVAGGEEDGEMVVEGGFEVCSVMWLVGGCVNVRWGEHT